MHCFGLDKELGEDIEAVVEEEEELDFLCLWQVLPFYFTFAFVSVFQFYFAFVIPFYFAFAFAFVFPVYIAFTFNTFVVPFYFAFAFAFIIAFSLHWFLCQLPRETLKIQSFACATIIATKTSE